jgi:hypothetical protein
MTRETLKMSNKERERLIIMSEYQRGEIQLKEAARKMGVSMRQAVRIKKTLPERRGGGTCPSLAREALEQCPAPRASPARYRFVQGAL